MLLPVQFAFRAQLQNVRGLGCREDVIMSSLCLLKRKMVKGTYLHLCLPACIIVTA